MCESSERPLPSVRCASFAPPSCLASLEMATDQRRIDREVRPPDQPRGGCGGRSSEMRMRVPGVAMLRRSGMDEGCERNAARPTRAQLGSCCPVLVVCA